ncbi:uncharacterized protein LOC135085174 [Ostrinia nubilalis]|uniref:uncharacterized protein LOC114351823 n=1 Tax=Ostrinia furnacalis TaxID=93504 RepID=UPI00103F652D|nr:uncharacterized protein LOC114351823 [Ostrinia furnacalis]
MSTMRVGRVSKHRRSHRVKSRAALRMMAIMQDRNSEEVPKEFLETGRTGRRNAMPDILHPQGAEVTTSDLPSRLQQLVTTDLDPQPGTSKTDLDVKKVDEPPAKKDSCS